MNDTTPLYLLFVMAIGGNAQCMHAIHNGQFQVWLCPWCDSTFLSCQHDGMSLQSVARV